MKSSLSGEAARIFAAGEKEASMKLLAVALGLCLALAGCAASYHPYGWPAGGVPANDARGDGASK